MKLLVVHPGASWSTADVYNGLTKALRRQGHELVSYNLDARIEHAGRFLHLAWNREKSRPRPTPGDTMYLACSGILERALRHSVDMVLVVSGMYLHPDWLVLLRRAGLTTGAVLTESPYDDEQQLRILPYVDIAWTNERTSVQYLRQANDHVYYLPHAYDSDVHRPDAPIPEDTPAHDVVFVGTGFQERIDLLSDVDWDGIDFGLYGQWNMLSSRHKLRKHLRGGPIDNSKASALYRRAKIGLNLYRTSKGFGKDAPRIDRAESLNPRAYELAACGAFHISEYRAEVEEKFDRVVPMHPVISYPYSLEAAIRYFLQNEEDRMIHAARLAACVEGETYDARAAQIINDMGRLNAPVHAALA